MSVSTNPAIEALLNAFAASADTRLLVSALDLAGQDSERRAVIAAKAFRRASIAGLVDTLILPMSVPA